MGQNHNKLLVHKQKNATPIDQMVVSKTLPFHSKEEITERINLVRRYSSFGLSPKEIQESLSDTFGITVTKQQIYLDLKDIREGKYDTFLDNLLDVHYPSIYEQVLTNLNDDLEYFKEMSERKDIDVRLQLKARVYHARISVELLNALHKGAVVRAMKQLSTRAKILRREVMQQDSIIKNRSQLSLITDQQLNLNKKVVTFDENMQRVEEEMIEIDPDLQKEVG